jgi:hypothetical protein
VSVGGAILLSPWRLPTCSNCVAKISKSRQKPLKRCGTNDVYVS